MSGGGSRKPRCSRWATRRASSRRSSAPTSSAGESSGASSAWTPSNGKAEPRRHPDRRPALRRDRRLGPSVPRDAAHRPPRARGRAVRQRVPHHAALLAEPRLDPHRAIREPPRHHRQRRPRRDEPPAAQLPPRAAEARLRDRAYRYPMRPNVRPLDEILPQKPAWREVFALRADPSSRAYLDPLHVGDQEEIRARAAMMASVDEGIGNLLSVLEETGQLDRTCIVFLGDNGYFFGEHGLGAERRFAY